MGKIIQFFNIQNNLQLFSSQEIIQEIKNHYNNTDLGKIDLAIPWERLKRHIRPNTSHKGPAPLVSIEGQIAMMVLKSYTGLSDKKLVEQINSNNHHRIFCRLPLTLGPIIKNHKYISRIRVKISKIIHWEKFQQILYSHWSPYIKNKEQILIDATCYETDMRYPTDVKLLWESLSYIIKKLKKIRKLTKSKMPRSKYLEIKKEYIIYSRLRKKGYKKTVKMIKKLLYLSHKLLLELEKKQENQDIKPESKQNLIKIILHQQSQKQKGEIIKSPILSLSKPYVRPIVRGKETKRVEFGAKVNKIQIEGINFIENLSYDNYNEGTRYKFSIAKAEELTQQKVKLTGGDAIYATNANRSYAKSRGIFTDFTRKGRAGKNEKSRKEASGIIRKERGSRLEGSFGVEKRIYGLDKIKARSEVTENLMIYFGIHTKNLLEIGNRILKTINATDLPNSYKAQA